MQKKLTITLDEQVYDGLHSVMGRRHISHFIEAVVWPHVLTLDLESAYQQMAQDEQRETEAWEWAEATVGMSSKNLFTRKRCKDEARRSLVGQL